MPIATTPTMTYTDITGLKVRQTEARPELTNAQNTAYFARLMLLHAKETQICPSPSQP